MPQKGVRGLVDKQELFLRVEQLQEQIGHFYQEIGALKLLLNELLEENQNLIIENGNLRDRVGFSAEEKAAPGEAKKYLRNLYDDGFHICNINYGSLRKGDCLFCLESLQRT